MILLGAGAARERGHRVPVGEGYTRFVTARRVESKRVDKFAHMSRGAGGLC